MVMEIHEDQPLVEPSGRNVVISEAVGTTGTVNGPVAWAVMPEMTLTLALNAGDLILIMWTGNLYVLPLTFGRMRFTVNGASISMEYRAGNQVNVANSARRSVYSMIKSYTVPAAANYTIELEWQTPFVGDVQSMLNERCLTVVRYY